MDRDLLFLLIGLLLSIPLSIVGNLATDGVKAFINKSIFSSRERRIKAFRRELWWTKILRETPALLALHLFRLLVLAFSYLVLLIGMVAVSSLETPRNIQIFPSIDTVNPEIADRIYTLGLLGVTAFCCVAFLRIDNLIKKILLFDRYQERVINKLRKLGEHDEGIEWLKKFLEEKAKQIDPPF